MHIFGTALLSLCVLAGLAAGRLAGAAFGLDSDLGGVGIAMILLIVCTDRLRNLGLLQPPTESGIVFWAQIYVPVVVAMAASQNVRGALQGGGMAALAGFASVVAAFLAMRLFGRGKGDA